MMRAVVYVKGKVLGWFIEARSKTHKVWLCNQNVMSNASIAKLAGSNSMLDNIEWRELWTFVHVDFQWSFVTFSHFSSSQRASKQFLSLTSF